jgi:SAM-dependent methyltransferase
MHWSKITALMEPHGGDALANKSRELARIDVHTPHAARVYDYALGGKDNYAADRELIEKLRALVPDTPLVAKENRAFLGRAVHFLADAGMRQFLDIGTGLPTQGNVHEVVRKIASDARVVYVDYDPVVIAHSRALLSGVDNVTIIQADACRPDDILHHPELRKRIDFNQPVALLLVGLLHLIADDNDPAGIIAQFRQALAPGSHLAICHITGDYQHPDTVAQWIEIFGGMKEPMVPRSHEQIQRFFDGFKLLDPGLMKASQWHPNVPSPLPSPATGWLLAGVGHMP